MLSFFLLSFFSLCLPLWSPVVAAGADRTRGAFGTILVVNEVVLLIIGDFEAIGATFEVSPFVVDASLLIGFSMAISSI